MADYRQVSEALAAGADPHMLCETCPWDRNCINPPSMTAAEVAEKTAPPIAKEGEKADGVLMAGLIASLAFAGKDTAAQVCPVFAVALRTSEGRQINEEMRSRMLAAIPR